MQDAEKTPGQPGSSQPRAGVPGLEVSLRQLSQRCFLQLCLAQQLFEARVLLAQLTQFLGLTTTHRPITLAPPAQRRLADTQHAAGMGRTHALTSQRLGLLQLHNNLLRRVLRELPHGHPFCPATSSQDYSEQPSQNKRSEKPRPLQHHDRQQIRQSADPFSQNRPFSATFVQWVCTLAATPPEVAVAPPPTGGNDAIQGSDTPATRRQRASHGAKPPPQPPEVHRVANKTWAQRQSARKYSPCTAPPAALPRKNSPSKHKNAKFWVF